MPTRDASRLHARKTVTRGYNKISSKYSSARSADSEDVEFLKLLARRLPTGSLVLDAGCGSGDPVTRFLAKSFQVVGIDFAERQIQVAHAKIRNAEFVCADITELPFKDNAFDAVCSYYAIIHIPRIEHSRLLTDFQGLLKHGGLVLLCLGAGDVPDEIGDYYGTRMFWSHYDSVRNLGMLRENKFEVLWSGIVKDPIDPLSCHLFVLAQKR